MTPRFDPHPATDYIAFAMPPEDVQALEDLVNSLYMGDGRHPELLENPATKEKLHRALASLLVGITGRERVPPKLVQVG